MELFQSRQHVARLTVHLPIEFPQSGLGCANHRRMRALCVQFECLQGIKWTFLIARAFPTCLNDMMGCQRGAEFLPCRRLRDGVSRPERIPKEVMIILVG
ncbi:MAG: hypothetical protein A3E56_03160 [Omnitrophica WOR_2 bacterium RIFCSPHIGHO2_12_FULL_64_13]|nr:MAG: hypothetical protein A3E56_03160 [Omnitrophica WOR_2 bacterium RIFCSPHIGHO2_12_FULL_64_13]